MELYCGGGLFMTMGSSITEKDIARFMSFVEKDNETGAWKWVGGVHSTGYGGFWLNGRTVGAHRVSYEIKYGPIPKDSLVCHKYEHLGRRNVNPDHLFLGTHTDNMQDAATKHRTAHGIRNGQSKLTENDVAAIRASDEKQCVLAVRYHISQVKISQIKRGTAWLHTADAPAKPVTIHSLANKSGYKGVRFKKNRWEANIVITTNEFKKTVYLGRYTDIIDAAKAYDAAVIEYDCDKKRLNFPEVSQENC